MSSSCPADAGQMPRSCSAGSLGHWEPGRHGIQPRFLLNSMKWSDHWAGHRERPGRQPRPSPLLCCVPCLGLTAQWLQWVQCFHLSPDHLAWKNHREPSGATGSSAQWPRPPNLPAGLKASPWTVGGGEAWSGLLEMETRSPFSCAIGKDLSLMSLLCILF